MRDEDEKRILRIVVTGPFSSGKTTFLDSLVIPFTDLDTPTRNRGLAPHRGWLDLQEALIYVYDTPGARRFDFMWEILAEGMLGFIVMVDCCKPQTFREASSITQTMAAYAPTPYVIAANFQNRSDAWDLEALRIALQMPREIRIVPCDATNRASVRGVLLALLEEVLKEAQTD